MAALPDLRALTEAPMTGPPVPPTETLTIEDALANASRLLRAAEVETNIPLMERLEKLADSWVSIAALLHQRSRDP
jgi:hypothetical protein